MKITTKVTATCAAVGLGAGCGLTPPKVSVDELASLKDLHEMNCPQNQVLNGAVYNDHSGSVSATVFQTERVPAIRQELTLVAVCGGSAKVVDFAGSSGASTTLWAGQLQPAGETLNSRLRKVPGLVDAAMQKIVTAHNAGNPLLSRGGTDIAAQFTNAGDFIRQTGDELMYRVVILTDGWSTTPSATSIRLPATATVVIAGVGQFDTSIKTPNEAQIAAAKQRLDDICAQTGATCIPAMTDYTTTTK